MATGRETIQALEENANFTHTHARTHAIVLRLATCASRLELNGMNTEEEK